MWLSAQYTVMSSGLQILYFSYAHMCFLCPDASMLIYVAGLQAEKVNIDREMKQLRQSTVLLNKRESIVDKRRESIATGLTKTKAQLSSAEHALQMKTVELEKSSFDLQLLQVCVFISMCLFGGQHE